MQTAFDDRRFEYDESLFETPMPAPLATLGLTAVIDPSGFGYDSTDAAFASLLEQLDCKLMRQIEAHGVHRYGIDAEDIAQDVRIRLWRALDRDPSTILSASYVRKVVTTTIVDAIRWTTCRNTELMPDIEEFEQLQDSDLDPERHAIHLQQITRIFECIATLPPRRRQTIELRLLGHSEEEAARQTGVTVESASKLFRRGMDDVRARLRACGVSSCL